MKLLLPVAALLAALSPLPASAHGEAGSGTTELTIGWAVEPAFAGFPNAVEVIARHDGSLRDDANLRVTVLFGDEDSPTGSDQLRLEKVFGDPGRYHASIIPTQAGRYTFHITGRVSEDKIDLHFTSGPRTFDDVTAPADLQFPETLPDAGELADRAEATDQQVTTLQADLAAARTAADDAESAASLARWLAIAALVVAAASIGLSLRARRG